MKLGRLTSTEHDKAFTTLNEEAILFYDQIV